MDFSSLDELRSKGAALAGKGPVALIFAEDPVEIASTVRHHVEAGFPTAIVFLPGAIPPPEAVREAAHWVTYDTHAPAATSAAVNAVIDLVPPKTWIYYGYNAEYLFFPFSETRNIKELLAFHTEERRDSMLTYVFDLYAPDLGRYPDGVDQATAMFDRAGYSARSRNDADTGNAKDRQLDIFGGLRWRFEDHVPAARRRIDRIGLFRSHRGLSLREDHTFNTEEYNTYSCPWHHNLTAAIMSFRTAKALKTNPGSTFDIDSFVWTHSIPFEWRSQQLLELGMIEPGQWF